MHVLDCNPHIVPVALTQRDVGLCQNLHSASAKASAKRMNCSAHGGLLTQRAHLFPALEQQLPHLQRAPPPLKLFSILAPIGFNESNTHVEGSKSEAVRPNAAELDRKVVAREFLRVLQQLAEGTSAFEREGGRQSGACIKKTEIRACTLCF